MEAPTEVRRRTSTATISPCGSRASRSTSRRPIRRLRERITQPLDAKERAASASASRPMSARCLGEPATTASSNSPRTSGVPETLGSRQETETCCHGGVGAAMMRRHTERIERSKMHGGWIAHI